ncbi:hypothetical protein J6590_033341 [Homalodisca vitripennis]|nr:hypothetical protein J6590_033341 [Homalodisca vitripennis]
MFKTKIKAVESHLQPVNVTPNLTEAEILKEVNCVSNVSTRKLSKGRGNLDFSEKQLQVHHFFNLGNSGKRFKSCRNKNQHEQLNNNRSRYLQVSQWKRRY